MMRKKHRRLNLPPIDRQTAKLVKRAWMGFTGVLILLLILQCFITPQNHFSYGQMPFFYPLSGFLACLLLILLSTLFSPLLKRRDRYYDRGEEL